MIHIKIHVSYWGIAVIILLILIIEILRNKNFKG